MSRPTRLLSLAGASALATVLLLADPAVAATATVNFDCQARPPIGAVQQLALSTPVNGTAPASAAAGSTFESAIAPDQLTVPAAAGGYTVNNIRDLLLKVPVPANSTYSSASLTGGSNLGTGTPSVSQAGGVVTVRVPGPIAGGATFQLPVLHLNLQASGAAGSVIETRLAGTSYAAPGLTFSANVHALFFNIDVPTSCFPSPSPTLTSTSVS